MNAKEYIHNTIENHKSWLTDLSEQIWQAAEISMREFRSSQLLMDALSKNDFAVTSNLADMPTAFIGEAGSGLPIIAFLGEFDALPNLSQASGITTHTPLDNGANGHGCGHNLLGVGSLAGAIALRAYLQSKNLPGTVRYYGCPGEEFGGGKAFLARFGCFSDVDCALTWHPADITGVWNMSSLANISILVNFKGIAAHAASTPHLGRSALDAAELMNIGVNYLREHIIPEARVHYAFQDAGGKAPNVVQDKTQLLYYIRAPRREQVLALFERIKKIAHGAALMTGTTEQIEICEGLSDYLPNQTLTALMHETLTELGAVPFNNSELAAAEKFRTLAPGLENSMLPDMTDIMAKSNTYDGKSLFNRILPNDYNRPILAGSTDVGDVSYVTPTAQFFATTWSLNTGFHTWQTTAQGCLSFAHTGMLYAGEALALTAVKFLQDKEVQKKAKREWQAATDEQIYRPLFPDDVMPPT